MTRRRASWVAFLAGPRTSGSAAYSSNRSCIASKTLRETAAYLTALRKRNADLFDNQLGPGATVASRTVRTTVLIEASRFIVMVRCLPCETAIGQGQAPVMVRFEGQAEIATFAIPYSQSVKLAGWNNKNFVDELASAKFRELGIEPSPLCSQSIHAQRMFELLRSGRL